MRLDEFRNSRPSDIDTGITHTEYKNLVNNIKKRMSGGELKKDAIKNELMSNWKKKKINMKKLITNLDINLV